MKKILSLAIVLLGVAAAQTNANAAVSIGISVGDNHRSGFLPPLPPLILPPLPGVHRGPVIVAPPRVVVADPCASHGHYYRGHDRYCDYRPAVRYEHSHRDDHRSHGYRRDEGHRGHSHR